MRQNNIAVRRTRTGVRLPRFKYYLLQPMAVQLQISHSALWGLISSSMKWDNSITSLED